MAERNTSEIYALLAILKQRSAQTKAGNVIFKNGNPKYSKNKNTKVGVPRIKET